MAKQQRPRVKLPPVEQIGIVVKDIEKTADYYTSTFGIGPFQIQDIALDDVMLYGRSVKTKFKIAFAHSGQVEIELIQPVEGDNPYIEFLSSRGEGLQHLRFRVDDLDGMLAELAEEGIEPTFYHRFSDFGIAFAYLNTDKIGGVVFELIEVKEPSSA